MLTYSNIYDTFKEFDFKLNFQISKIRKFKLAIFLLIAIFTVIVFVIKMQRALSEADTAATKMLINMERNTTVYLRNARILRLPTTICSRDSFLTIFVPSSPENFVSRKAIRDTWGSHDTIFDRKINIYFIVGIPPVDEFQKIIEAESATYDDIIQNDFLDTYYNLTVKSLMILKTAQEYCLKRTKYIYKVDDDIFLNLRKLMEVLMNAKRENLIMGYKYYNIRPDRHPLSKWYVPLTIYPEDNYPNLVSGVAYVISIDLVPKLLDAAITTPLYHLEDVYITGFLAQKIGVDVTDQYGFHKSKMKFMPCTYKDVITSHEHTPNELRTLYDLVYFVDLNKLCENFVRSLQRSILLRI